MSRYLLLYNFRQAARLYDIWAETRTTSKQRLPSGHRGHSQNLRLKSLRGPGGREVTVSGLAEREGEPPPCLGARGGGCSPTPGSSRMSARAQGSWTSGFVYDTVQF